MHRNLPSFTARPAVTACFPSPVAKHALIGLTCSLGINCAARGIRVNSVLPGLILTESTGRWLAACPDPQA